MLRLIDVDEMAAWAAELRKDAAGDLNNVQVEATLIIQNILSAGGLADEMIGKILTIDEIESMREL
jgi:hypothetical protein